MVISYIKRFIATVTNEGWALGVILAIYVAPPRVDLKHDTMRVMQSPSLKLRYDPISAVTNAEKTILTKSAVFSLGQAEGIFKILYP